MMFADVGVAKSVSRAVALAMLFCGGLALGRYAGFRQLEGRPDHGRAGQRARGRDQRARRMMAAARVLAGCAALRPDGRGGMGRRGKARRARRHRRNAPPWAFAVTAYPTVVRGGQNYTSGIATADRGPLHLEARVNYESIGARSAFVGWNFSGGDTLTWELTPLLGGAWGTTQAFVPGLEATLAWRKSTSTSRPNTCAVASDSTEELYLCLERAGLAAGRVAALRAGRPAHQHLRWRAQLPARAVCAGHLGPGHAGWLLVQPGIVGADLRGFDRRRFLSLLVRNLLGIFGLSPASNGHSQLLIV